MTHLTVPTLVLVFSLLSACGPAHDQSVPAPLDAPLFTALLGAPIPGVPGEAAWARRVGEADHALASGRPGEARVLLAEAIVALSEEPTSCAVSGAVLFLQGMAAKLSGAGDDDDSWATLSATCSGDVVAIFKDLWGWLERPAAVRPEELYALRNAAAVHQEDRVVLFAAAADWIELAGREPPDVCDRTFAPRQRQELAQLTEILETRGRPDLAMFGLVRALVVDRKVVPEAVAALAAWADAPSHLWLRREALGRALGGLTRRADWVDPLLTVPICALYYDALLAEIDADHGDGVHGRNATRLAAAWSAAPSCLDRAPVRGLTDRVISAAASGGAEPMTVLEALGGLAGQITLTALDGRSGDLPTLLGEVAEALRRLRQGLGNEREDRVLHASLGVFAGAAELFRGRADLALKEIGMAADLLDHLAESGLESPSHKEGVSEIERFAPAFRSGSLAALALLQWLTDQGGLAAGTLQRLDVTLEGDLSALFKALDTPDHSAAITRIARGISKAIAKDWSAAVAALEEATIPGPEETGWWSVGLDAGRMTAWDLLAVLAWKEAPEVGKAALAKGEVVSRRLVDNALEHFEVRGTGWELLTVLPLAHQVVPGFVAEEADWKSILKELVLAVEPVLEQALSRVEAPGDAPLGFTDLLIDVLRDATDVGLDTMVEQREGALPRLADLLEARIRVYRGELRFILGMLAGTARFFSNTEAASQVFNLTLTMTPKSMGGVSWMPHLLEAMLLLRSAGDTAAALAKLDEVVAQGERAASCDVDDPVHALLPVRMWLREIAGDGVGATEDYRAFRRMTARGFAGYATIACRLNSQRGSLSVNAQLSQSLGALFIPAGTEGAFNVGAGWTSLARDMDDVGCWAAVAAGPRDDAILHTHLAAAMYAMRRGDDVAAHRALADAVAAGRRLVNGGPAILGKTKAAAVDAARKAVSLDLLAWVTFTARIRGHISAADRLVDQAVWLLRQRETTWGQVLPEDHETPIFLARLPNLPSIGGHVRAWHIAKDHAGKVAAMKALKKDRALKKAKLLPRWGIKLVKELQAVSAANAAGKPMPELSKPPGGLQGSAVVGAWTWVVGLWKAPASFSLQGFLENADALSSAGLYREIVGIAATVVALTRGTQLEGMGWAVLAAAADRIPQDTFPVTRAAVLNELASVWMQSNDLMLALAAHRDLVPALSGRVAQRIELENRLNLVNLLGTVKMVPDLAVEVRVLLPMLERSYGRGEEVFHSLLSVDVALRIFHGIDVPPDAAIDALVATADAIKGAAPAKQFFRILASTTDPQARRKLAVDYLRFMFLNGPPLQEPVAPPTVTPTSGSPRTQRE